MAQQCKWLGCILVINQFLCTANERIISTFPTFQYDLLPVCLCITGDCYNYSWSWLLNVLCRTLLCGFLRRTLLRSLLCCAGIFTALPYALNHIAFLAYRSEEHTSE